MQVHEQLSKGSASDNLSAFSAELEINDYSQKARYKLTAKVCQYVWGADDVLGNDEFDCGYIACKRHDPRHIFPARQSAETGRTQVVFCD
jgi:hypothetical protein